MTDRPHWNRASLAQQRSLQKPRVMHGVCISDNAQAAGAIASGQGELLTIVNGDISCCGRCGYHVCSCPPKPRHVDAVWHLGAAEPKPKVRPDFDILSEDLTSSDITAKMAAVEALLRVGKTLRVTHSEWQPMIGLMLRKSAQPDRFEYSLGGEDWTNHDPWSALTDAGRTFGMATYEVVPKPAKKPGRMFVSAVSAEAHLHSGKTLRVVSCSKGPDFEGTILRATKDRTGFRIKQSRAVSWGPKEPWETLSSGLHLYRVCTFEVMS